jgi:hypothetical protein
MYCPQGERLLPVAQCERLHAMRRQPRRRCVARIQVWSVGRNQLHLLCVVHEVFTYLNYAHSCATSRHDNQHRVLLCIAQRSKSQHRNTIDNQPRATITHMGTVSFLERAREFSNMMEPIFFWEADLTISMK